MLGQPGMFLTVAYCNPGVVKVGTAGTDDRRHILETTFLQAHFVKRLKPVLK